MKLFEPSVIVPTVGTVLVAIVVAALGGYILARRQGESRRQAVRPVWRYWLPAAALVLALSLIIGYALADDGGGDGAEADDGKTPPPTPSDSPTGTGTSSPPEEGEEEHTPSPLPGKPADPELWVAPDTASPGDTITVEGSGFDPGEKVRIYWTGEHILGGEELRDIQADDEGGFTVEVVVIEHPYHEPREQHTDRVKAEGLTSGVTTNALVIVTT